MIHPDRKTFKRLAENYNIIPLFKTVPADLETPISLYLKLAFPGRESFLLESGEVGEKSRYSFIGSEPFLTLYTLGSDTVVREENGKRWCSGGDPLHVLEKVFQGFNVYRPEELSGFWGGAAGYLSYDLMVFLLMKKSPRLKRLPFFAGWIPCSFMERKQRLTAASFIHTRSLKLFPFHRVCRWKGAGNTAAVLFYWILNMLIKKVVEAGPSIGGWSCRSLKGSFPLFLPEV